MKTGALLENRVLLAVFAHPDDESLSCGGVLARCIDEGARVVLVCATSGEDGGDLEASPAPEPLSVRRRRELEDAAAVLGIRTVSVLGFEDGMLPWLDGDQLEGAIAAALERWSPDLVVTFDEDGLYWHPDHIAIHKATTAAVARMTVGRAALYYVSLPEGRMRALVDAVHARLPHGSPKALLGVDAVDGFGTLAPTPDITVDVKGAVERKLRALRCHRSQTDGGPFSVLKAAEAAAFLGIEQFRRAPVGDASTPLLELLAVEDQSRCR